MIEEEDDDYELENGLVAFCREFARALWALVVAILTGVVVVVILYIISYALIGGLPR